MAGYLPQLQKGLGRAIKAVHRVGGYRAQYMLTTDKTTDPVIQSTLTIFMQPTPTVKLREILGGRYQMILSAAGQLSAEALPVWIVSRESLIVSGVYYEPTFFDTWQELDSAGAVTGPIFYPFQIVPVGAVAAGWALMGNAEFSRHGKG